jgi:hypothetical protein
MFALDRIPTPYLELLIAYMGLILAGSVAIATLDSLNKPRFVEITSRLDTIIELLREKSMSSSADLGRRLGPANGLSSFIFVLLKTIG